MCYVVRQTTYHTLAAAWTSFRIISRFMHPTELIRLHVISIGSVVVMTAYVAS